MQSCFAESCRFLQASPAASGYIVDVPHKRQQKAGEPIRRHNQRWRAAAKITEEEDTLLWEATSPETATSQVSDSHETASDEDGPVEDFWVTPEAEQDPSPSRNGNWEQSVSKEEQIRLDEEAREFAYGFGNNEARDVLDGSVSTDEDEAEQLEAQAASAGPSGGKGKKGRKRNERRGGRPKDSSIPLHMLPKVRPSTLMVSCWLSLKARLPTLLLELLFVLVQACTAS